MIADGRNRQRVVKDQGGSKESSTVLMGGTTAGGYLARCSVLLAGGLSGGDSAQRSIEYRIAKGEAREPGVCVPLSEHNSAVSAVAGRMANSLALGNERTGAVTLAALLHDLGKARAVWQRYANNANIDVPIAKSDRYGHWKMLGGYRHEFGSLLDAAADARVAALDEHSRDLVLHLIASHHGWARPHFEPSHFDRGDLTNPRSTVECERAAAAAMQRFARLQQRFGRWGLAWLESVVRCADAEASATIAVAPDRVHQQGTKL